MKNIFILLVILLVILTGCESDEIKPVLDKGSVKEINFNAEKAGIVYKSATVNEETGLLDRDYLNAIDEFGYDILNSVYNTKENINVSPISAHMILSLISHGASQKTKSEIKQTLQIDHLSDDEIAKNNKMLYEHLYENNEIGKLLIANSIWKRESLDFKEQFIERGKQYYSELYDVDFSDDETAENMNKWVRYHTNDLINPLLETDSSRLMVLMNTLYFYDEWLKPFDKDLTGKEIFNTGSSNETVDMMNQTFDSKSYYEGDEFYKTFLKVKDLGSVSFVLPKDGVSINDFINDKALYTNAIRAVCDKTTKIKFKLPKVDFNSKIDLKETLKSLGMIDAFNIDDADFSNMVDKSIFISTVQQMTHLTFDEKKVEAAAVTIIEDDAEDPPVEEKILEFYLDRPFMYIIENNEGVVIFVGVINNPNIE